MELIEKLIIFALFGSIFGALGGFYFALRKKRKVVKDSIIKINEQNLKIYNSGKIIDFKEKVNHALESEGSNYPKRKVGYLKRVIIPRLPFYN